MNDRYWSKRGELCYVYKGEKFYTITPLPFYLKRRKILLDNLNKVISRLKKEKLTLRVCDFGSGDGFYCCWLAKKLPGSEITGFDISPTMTEEAIKRVEEEEIPNIALYCDDFNNKDKSYDLVLSLAVLQHFRNKDEIAKKAKQIYSRLEDGGFLVLFEATSKKPGASQKLLKRTEDFYQDIFESNGFKLIEKQFISFPFFNLYQRKFLNLIKRSFRGDPVQKSIAINRNFFVNGLNKFALMLGCFFDKFFTPQDGNTFFVFRKV